MYSSGLSLDTSRPFGLSKKLSETGRDVYSYLNFNNILKSFLAFIITNIPFYINFYSNFDSFYEKMVSHKNLS